MPIVSLSKNPTTVRCICPGLNAKKNAARRPVRLSKISLPKKYITKTVKAPANAGK